MRKLKVVKVPASTKVVIGEETFETFEMGVPDAEKLYMMHFKSDDMDVETVKAMAKKVGLAMGIKTRVMIVCTDTDSEVELYEVEPPETRN